jgi:hypothetical protein
MSIFGSALIRRSFYPKARYRPFTNYFFSRELGSFWFHEEPGGRFVASKKYGIIISYLCRILYVVLKIHELGVVAISVVAGVGLCRDVGAPVSFGSSVASLVAVTTVIASVAPAAS